MTEPTIDRAIEIISDHRWCRKRWDQGENDGVACCDLAIKALEEMKVRQEPKPRTPRDVTVGEVLDLMAHKYYWITQTDFLISLARQTLDKPKRLPPAPHWRSMGA
jgi:hypothetical protein